MSSITLQHEINGTLTAATSVKLSASDASYGIKNADTGAVVVADNTATSNPSTGAYSYDISALAAGNYTASWEVVYSGITTYTLQNFSVDAATSTVDGVTLADIERELAMRVGPYYRESAASGPTTTTVVIDAFKSTLSHLSGLEDLYVLRRGLKNDGSAVVGFDSDDRIRLVDSIDTATGTVTVDRVWTTAPVADEELEFHHLHPQNELRRAVLEGLKRCYVPDRVTITFTTAAAERNLTSSATWLTNARQVLSVAFLYSTGTTYLPSAVGWWNVLGQGGDVLLQAARDPYPNTMVVSALRPAFSLVNGVTTTTGPDDDSDVLTVDLAYAAAAGHVEAWRRFRARLLPAAQTGLQASQAEAAREFTRQSRKYAPRRAQPWMLGDPVGFWGPELP